MNIKAIKTRIMQPPQDDLFEVLDESLPQLQERDVLVVTSKIVAIGEGRCVPVGSVDKEELIKQEADLYVNEADSRWRICMKHHTFLAGAGIDESNASDHYILLPEKPFESAKSIYDYVREKYGIENLGIIITDSRSFPLRYGTLGVALSWWGFEPVSYFTGEPDLFGRPAKFTRINVADSLAVSGVFGMGELGEQTPLALIREVPHIKFISRDTSRDLFIPPREDIYWPLFKRFFEDE